MLTFQTRLTMRNKTTDVSEPKIDFVIRTKLRITVENIITKIYYRKIKREGNIHKLEFTYSKGFLHLKACHYHLLLHYSNFYKVN